MEIVKIILKVLGGLFVVALVVLAGGFFWISRGLKNKNMKINNIDISKVKDGTYEGEFVDGRWSNKVQVTVKDHKLTDIKIVKDVQFSLKEKEDELLSRIIKKQSLEVDAISSGTVTSKSILKSVERALEKGLS